ncbi:MAG: DUF3999 family protein [Thermoanaerobaculia bacterium]
MKHLWPALLCGVLAASPAAPAGPESNTPFAQEREVFPAARGLNRLEVDVTLLSASRSREGDRLLSDLRFFTAAGTEVPYLLIEPRAPSPDELPARLFAVAPTKKESGVEADLGKAELIDRLTVTGIPSPFMKRVRLEGSGDRARWTLLEDEATLFDLPQEKLSRTTLDFPPGIFRYLRLTWDDASSARVPMPRTLRARRADRRSPAPPFSVTVPFEKRASEPGVSRYHVRLPAARLPIRALELIVSGGNVLRAARISEARLAGSQLVPTELGSAMLRRAVRGELIADEMLIPLAAPAEAGLDLEVEDGSNAPLPLTGIRARFAPLPRIVFESADGAPLVARTGRENVNAPRYDLEATRESLQDSIDDLAAARWGVARTLTGPSPASIATGVGDGAPIDVTLFPVVRQIPVSPPGLTALKLDVALLSATERLSGIRIATTDGRQVPYLLETLAEPLSLELAPLAPIAAPPARRSDSADPAGASSTFYRVKKPYRSLPEARLVIETPSRVFTRHALLLVDTPLPRGEERDAGMTTIADALWSHADPDSPAPALTLTMPGRQRGDLTLAIDDGDNAPLALQKPRLLLTSYRLRFFRKEGQMLRLLAGATGVDAPRYDLALLAPRLLGAAATEISLDSTGAAPSGPTLEATSRKVFWGILAGAVAILLALMVRLVGSPGVDGGGSKEP